MLEITHHPLKGRCYSLSQPVSAGTLLLKAAPFALVPDCESRRRVCASCLCWSEQSTFLHHTCFSTYSNVEAIPGSRSVSLNELFFQQVPKKSCTKVSDKSSGRVGPPCHQVFYCSVECSERDWVDYHAVECSFFRELFMGIPAPLPMLTEANAFRDLDDFDNYSLDFLWMLMRVLIRRAREVAGVPLLPTTGASQDFPTFDQVWAICDNADSFPLESIQLFHRIASRLSVFVREHLLVAFPGIPVDGLLPKTSDKKQEPQQHLFDSLVSLICKEECNSFGLYTFRYLGPQYSRQGYALALYPTAVFFNHACTPNVGHVTRSSTTGKEMLFYSLKDLKAGDEALISYLALETNHPDTPTLSTAERRQKLKEHFFFDCDCDRCAQELGGTSEEKADFLKSQLCTLNGCRGRFVPGFPGVFDSSAPNTISSDYKSDRKDSGKSFSQESSTQVQWRCEACHRFR